MSTAPATLYSLDEHSYSQPLPTASRSPCPALNALANHGYLNRDGRSLTIVQLIRALVEVYDLSVPLAVLLSLVGVVLCGNWWSLDLHQLAKHGVIEHNGSLVHADTVAGQAYAPTGVDPKLVKQLLSVTSSSSLSLRDFAKARALRDSTIPTPLDAIHAEIARGEAALSMQVFGWKAQHADGFQGAGAVPKLFVEQLFGEERLPDGWKKPLNPVGLVRTAFLSRRLEQIIHTSLA